MSHAVLTPMGRASRDADVDSGGRRWAQLHWILQAIAAGAFLYGVTTVRHAEISEYGLLATASPLFGLSIVLTAIAFALAVRRSSMPACVTATVLMIAAQRLVCSVATDSPMYSWTYKHLGVVDYIQHEHMLARGVDIYNGWPGLFALTAWVSDLTGVSAAVLAHWFTIFFQLAFVALAYAVARAWNAAPIVAITAAFLVATLNWVAQDYFSPQAVAMLLTAGVMIFVGLSARRGTGVAIIVLLFAAMTITHQLTPYWVLGAMGLMVLTRRLRPWWIVIPLAAIVIGQTAYNFGEVSNFTLFSLDVAQNAKSNIPTVGSIGQQFTSYAVRALSGGVWLLTALCLLLRWRRKEPFWVFGILALSPMLILGGQGYGGEAIFRVFLYSLLGCSIVLAGPAVRMLQRGPGRFSLAASVLVVATALSAQGYLGAWFANVMPKEQVDASQSVLEQAEFPAYLTVAAPVWPQRSTWRYVSYAKFDEGFDDPMIYSANLVGSHFDTDADYEKFTQAINYRNNATTYLIFTEQMRLYAWYFGILPLDSLPNLKARVVKDPAWKAVYDDQGLSVFEHRVEQR